MSIQGEVRRPGTLNYLATLTKKKNFDFFREEGCIRSKESFHQLFFFFLQAQVQYIHSVLINSYTNSVIRRSGSGFFRYFLSYANPCRLLTSRSGYKYDQTIQPKSTLDVIKLAQNVFFVFRFLMYLQRVDRLLFAVSDCADTQNFAKFLQNQKCLQNSVNLQSF